jgi:para-aminobenzoate synthetase / 4-amino-4-deoxychorismate lyase
VSASDWRPDPTKGVFETLLVVGGEPVEMDRHLRRLAHSLDVVFSLKLPPGTEEELRRAAEGISLGRLRLTVVPAEDGPRHELLAGGVVPGAFFPTRSAHLRTHPVSGGRGPHKWVDRRGMEHPDTGSGQLICDGEELLEAGWANLFAVREETLWTPPADGRILAGTARAALLKIAREEGIEAREEPVRAEDLLGADEVFLTNSIRGIEPAASLDGRSLAGCGPVSRRLGAALRRRWGLPDAVGDPAALAAAPQPGPLSR